jgi:hypothetical protein
MEILSEDSTLEDISKFYEEGTFTVEVWSDKAHTMKSLNMFLDQKGVKGFVSYASRIDGSKLYISFEDETYMNKFIKNLPEGLCQTKATQAIFYTLFIERTEQERKTVKDAITKAKLEICDLVDSKNHTIIHFNDFKHYVTALTRQFINSDGQYFALTTPRNERFPPDFVLIKIFPTDIKAQDKKILTLNKPENGFYHIFRKRDRYNNPAGSIYAIVQKDFSENKGFWSTIRVFPRKNYSNPTLFVSAPSISKFWKYVRKGELTLYDKNEDFKNAIDEHKKKTSLAPKEQTSLKNKAEQTSEDPSKRSKPIVLSNTTDYGHHTPSKMDLK